MGDLMMEYVIFMKQEMHRCMGVTFLSRNMQSGLPSELDVAFLRSRL